MDERAAFLRQIAAAPGDDAPRLVFADWLDERGDPLGEFIRLQLELEPLRQPRATPETELQRLQLLDALAPAAELPGVEIPLARQFGRERELLKQHRADWLGPLAPLVERHEAHFNPVFRRGLVAAVQVGLTAFLEHGLVIRTACPALERLVVCGTLNRCGALAANPALRDLPELTLAGWLLPADAVALAISPHLGGLRSLRFWVGPDDGPDDYRPLGRLPGLREVVLVQMWGGISVNNPEELDRRADTAADAVNIERGERIARVERPFERRFPLDGIHVGYGINAGYLPDGQPVLFRMSRQPVLIHFDAEGRPVREEQLNVGDQLVKPPQYWWEPCDEGELIELLQREVGFQSSPIFVQEFSAETADIGLCWPGVHEDELGAPRTADPEDAEEVGASLYWWWSTGQFCLPFGNCYWADGRGRVHSS